MPAWDELFLRQRTNGSLVTGVEVQEKSHYKL